MAQAEGSGLVLLAHPWDSALSDASAVFRSHLRQECAQSADAQAARQVDAVRVQEVPLTVESHAILGTAVGMVIARGSISDGDNFILAFLEPEIAALPGVSALFEERGIALQRLREAFAEFLSPQ